MAMTVAAVSSPNAAQVSWTEGPFTHKLFTITPDSSYPDGGETFTAAQFGLSYIAGVVVWREFALATGEELIQSNFVPASTGLTMQCFLYFADDAAPDDEADSVDASLYSARVEVIGYP